jgi:hypothetical protein
MYDAQNYLQHYHSISIFMRSKKWKQLRMLCLRLICNMNAYFVKLCNLSTQLPHDGFLKVNSNWYVKHGNPKWLLYPIVKEAMPFSNFAVVMQVTNEMHWEIWMASRLLVEVESCFDWYLCLGFLVTSLFHFWFLSIWKLDGISCGLYGG